MSRTYQALSVILAVLLIISGIAQYSEKFSPTIELGAIYGPALSKHLFSHDAQVLAPESNREVGSLPGGWIDRMFLMDTVKILDTQPEWAVNVFKCDVVPVNPIRMSATESYCYGGINTMMTNFRETLVGHLVVARNTDNGSLAYFRMGTEEISQFSYGDANWNVISEFSALLSNTEYNSLFYVPEIQ